MIVIWSRSRLMCQQSVELVPFNLRPLGKVRLTLQDTHMYKKNNACVCRHLA
jgi:hypothetical protein